MLQRSDIIWRNIERSTKGLMSSCSYNVQIVHIACISQSCHSINPIQMVIASYYSGNRKEEKAPRLFSIKVCGAITQYKHGLKVHRANFLDSFFACKKEDLSSFSFGKVPLSKWANGYHTLNMKCVSHCLKLHTKHVS